MNLTIKLMLCILCLNLSAQIGKAESSYPPPVEKIKPPVEKKKRKKKKTKKLFFRNKFKKTNHPKNNTVTAQQMSWETVFHLTYLSLIVIGIIAFIVGAALVNPLVWIIGGVAFLVGFICWIIYSLLPIASYYSAVYLISAAVILALIGIALLIIGLLTGTFVLWVGGLIFILPLVIWALIGLFSLISRQG